MAGPVLLGRLPCVRRLPADPGGGAAPLIMPGVFISYRRDDSAAAAGRLFDALRQRCRADVFLDVTTRAGSDFRKVIEEKLDGCDVVLAVIGRTWLSVRNPRKDVRRLDEKEDYVRFELAAAFRKQKTVIPVLVGGATIPREEEIPEEISALSYSIAIELRHEHWDADVNTLIAQLPEGLGCEAGPVGARSWGEWLAAWSIPVALLTAAHVFMVKEIESYTPPEVHAALAAVIGVVQGFQFPATGTQRLGLAGGIALGAGLLLSVVVSKLHGVPIISSMVEARQIAVICAAILGGYLAGTLAAGALLRRRRNVS